MIPEIINILIITQRIIKIQNLDIIGITIGKAIKKITHKVSTALIVKENDMRKIIIAIIDMMTIHIIMGIDTEIIRHVSDLFILITNIRRDTTKDINAITSTITMVITTDIITVIDLMNTTTDMSIVLLEV